MDNDGMVTFIIIDGGRRPDALQRLLTSIARQRFPSLEIILVGKMTGMEPDDAIRIEAPTLAEQGAICALRNLGIAKSSGDPVVLLDDDIELMSGWGATLNKMLTDDSWDIASTRILGPSGERWYDWCWASMQDPSCPTRLINYDESPPGLYISGALMILRRRVFEKVLFDESLLNHQRDDVDFCHRASGLSFRFACFAEATAIHHLEPAGRSSSDPASGSQGFTEAIYLFRKGDFDSAYNILSHLPDSPEVVYHRALSLKNMGKADEARQIFEKVLAGIDISDKKQRRLYYSSFFHLGAIFESKGQSQEAANHYRRALSGIPEHFEAAQGLQRMSIWAQS